MVAHRDICYVSKQHGDVRTEPTPIDQRATVVYHARSIRSRLSPIAARQHTVLQA